MRQTQNAQKKDNRKSIFVIGLLLLLVAVIGFGGYTLSKYVTKKEASGNASVAKWGFTVTSETNNLFGANYEFKTGATNSTVTATNDATKLTVKASSENSKVVAPGTTGSMTFTIGGTAEVKAAVAINMTVTKDVVLKYTATGVTGVKEYNPVKWTLKKGENKLVENSTLAKIAEELNKAAYDETINPGADYTNAATYTIEWVWDFDANGVGTNDELDTFLGTIASTPSTTTYGNYTKAEGTSTEIKFDLNISITQVKE